MFLLLFLRGLLSVVIHLQQRRHEYVGYRWRIEGNVRTLFWTHVSALSDSTFCLGFPVLQSVRASETEEPQRSQ